MRSTFENANILAVEAVDPTAFRRFHVGQIILRKTDADPPPARTSSVMGRLRNSLRYKSTENDCTDILYFQAKVRTKFCQTVPSFKSCTYFPTQDVNDAHCWISVLRKMIINNDTLDYFHPGIFRKNKWTCCRAKIKTKRGCSKTHTDAVRGDWRDPLDRDVEAQVIFSQLCNGLDKLR